MFECIHGSFASWAPSRKLQWICGPCMKGISVCYLCEILISIAACWHSQSVEHIKFWVTEFLRMHSFPIQLWQINLLVYMPPCVLDENWWCSSSTLASQLDYAYVNEFIFQCFYGTDLFTIFIMFLMQCHIRGYTGQSYWSRGQKTWRFLEAGNAHVSCSTFSAYSIL